MFSKKDKVKEPKNRFTATNAGRRMTQMAEVVCHPPIWKMKIPKATKQETAAYYTDLITDQPVLKTPEETVKQQTIQYLLTKAQVPASCFSVTGPIGASKANTKDFIDISVTFFENGKQKDLLIGKCEAPKVSVCGESIRKMLKYHSGMPGGSRAKYLFVTNGRDSVIYAYSLRKDKYIAISDLPLFSVMEEEQAVNTQSTAPKKTERPERAMLETPDYIKTALQVGIAGEQSRNEITVLAQNIYYFLMDTSERFPQNTKGRLCEIIADHAATRRICVNPDKSANDLKMQWIEAWDRKSKEISVFYTVTGGRQLAGNPDVKAKSGNTFLLAAVEHRGKTVPVLTLDLDRFARYTGSRVSITHDGRSAKRTQDEAMDYIAALCPELLDEERNVYLGTIENGENIHKSNASAAEFFLRLTDYTLIRYEMWQKDRRKKPQDRTDGSADRDTKEPEEADDALKTEQTEQTEQSSGQEQK